MVEDGYYRPSDTQYKIRKIFFEDSRWRTEDLIVNDRYIVAAMKASELAKEMDAKFGDSHFWTVTLKTMDGGDFFQLFHGRLE